MKCKILLLVIMFMATICYSQAPHIQWQRTIGGSNDDELYSLEQTRDGGYILGGSSNSGISGDKTSNTCSNSSFDYWIVKVDCGGAIQWQTDIGGGDQSDGIVGISDDIVNSIKQTTDGGYIVGGYSNYSDVACQKTTTGYGYDDWWVLKLDSLGNIQWQVDLGGSCNDFLNAIEQTADDGYILGGDSRSNADGNKTVNMCNYGDCDVLSDYWVVKLNNAGVVQWQQGYGGFTGTEYFAGDDNLNSIQQTSDGGYILGGSSNSNISCTKATDCYDDSYDYWILKIDSVGNLQWQKQIGGNSLDALNSIQQTADGGYIAGGTSNSNISGNKTSNTWNNSSDYYVVKLDSAGNIQWQKDIGGDKYDGLNSIEQTTDHGYILGGFSNSDSSGDKTSNPLGGYGSGQYDYWIVKLDSQSNIQWQLDVGRNDTQAVLFAVQQTTDGGYILGGVCNPSSANLSGKINNVGNPFGEQYGGSGTHYWIVKLGNCAATYCGAPPQAQDSICLGDSVMLNGIIEYGGYNWEAMPGGSPTSSLSCTACMSPIAAPMLTTKYVELTASSPNLYCSDTATVVVTPLPNNFRIDTNVCFGNSVQLNASVNNTTIPHTIIWSPALYLSNDSIANPICTPLADTDITYTVIITNNNAAHCGNVDTVNVIHFKKISLLDSDTTICPGTTVKIPLVGDTAYQYLWTPDTWLNNDVIKNPLANPDTTTIYTVVASYMGCKDTVSYLINVIYIPDTVGFTMSDSAICAGKSIIFQGNYSSGNSGVQWNFGDGSFANQNPVLHTYDSAGKMAVILTVTYSGSCPNLSYKDSVTIYPAPVIHTIDTGICPHDTINIYATGGISYHWVAYNNGYISDTAIQNPKVSPPTDWSYTVSGTNESGCIDTATAQVKVYSNAVIQLPDSVILYYGQSYQFNPGTNCSTFNWFPPQGLSADDISDPVASPEANTQYIVTGTTENGCMVKEVVNVYRDNDVLLTLPNAFSPGNGPDNILKPIYRGNITLDYLRIYNRWGQLVYESKDLNEGWDGTWHGTPQPQGVFVYELEGHTAEGKIISKQGNITLLR